MTTKNLLVELFVEELPPKALRKLGEAFSSAIAAGLAKADLVDTVLPPLPTMFATPRRLAVLVPSVRAKADDRVEDRKLVPVSVGRDADGQPHVAGTELSRDAHVRAGLRDLPLP